MTRKKASPPKDLIPLDEFLKQSCPELWRNYKEALDEARHRFAAAFHDPMLCCKCGEGRNSEIHNPPWKF